MSGRTQQCRGKRPVSHARLGIVWCPDSTRPAAASCSNYGFQIMASRMRAHQCNCTSPQESALSIKAKHLNVCICFHLLHIFRLKQCASAALAYLRV